MSKETRASPERVQFDRRKLLQGLGAAGAASLAGCPSLGGGGGGDIEGERVPEQTMHYWSSVSQFQDVAPVVENAMEELGISVSSSPAELATNVEDILNDGRAADISLWLQPNQPGKADPVDLFDGFMIQFAGADTANGNWSNWPDCEYTDTVADLAFAQSVEEQSELSQQAAELMSEGAALIPLVENATFGVFNTDRVEPGPVGIGIGDFNPNFYIEMEPIEGDTVRCNTDSTNVSVRDFTAASASTIYRNHLAHSGLITVDEEFNVVPELAEDWEISDDGTTYEFTLLEGATFHNGDAITAEDVKWTFEFLNETADRAPVRNQVTYADAGIEAVDERTVRFNLEQPFLTLLRKTLFRWGVLHPPSWEAVRQDPENGTPADPIVGSGPFEVTSFQVERSMTLEPHDGHPRYSPDHNITFEYFEDQNTLRQAFLNDEIDVVAEMSAAGIEAAEEEMGDSVTVTVTEAFVPYYLLPQCSTATWKFIELRKALGAAVNRQEINDIVFLGRSEPVLHGSIYLDGHPQIDGEALPTFTDSPTGDVEAARQMLSEAGWEWDDNGNLYFPPDADTGPAWPQGERPSPDDFECLTADGEYDGPTL